MTDASKGTHNTNPLRGGITIASVFFLVAIALGGVLPLWLDEIIQLRETRNTSPVQLIASLPGQAGAAPLGYLVQQTVLQATGYSVRSARFPSALFVAGAVIVVALLGAELGLARPWLAAGLFALFPITLRYACESRIYSQALFFSALATLLFIRFEKNPRWLGAGWYCLALAAAIYSQPYAIFVAPAHILYAAVCRDRKAAALSTVAAALAVSAFLPWYFWTKANWTAGIAGAGVHFVVSAKTPLMLFREVAGAGYWGSGLLLTLCVMAVARRGKHSRAILFLILSIGVPVVLALAADGLFGYFVATRQILWVLPALAIFAGLAIERKPRVALPLTVVFAAFCVWQSVRNFTAPGEDWQLAANLVSNEVQQGACLMVVPPEQEYPYRFFRPELARAHCPSTRIVVAVTPYATNTQRVTAVSALTAEGYTRQYRTEAGKSEISLFAR